MGGERGFVTGGGLICYGSDSSEGWRLAARYVDRILKRAKPAGEPVYRVAKDKIKAALTAAVLARKVQDGTR